MILLQQDRLSKQQEYIRTMQDWYSFKGETKEFYGVDMTVLEVTIFFFVFYRETAHTVSFPIA